jgi:uncharacterized C2H2 Zn-finger protein
MSNQQYSEEKEKQYKIALWEKLSNIYFTSQMEADSDIKHNAFSDMIHELIGLTWFDIYYRLKAIRNKTSNDIIPCDRCGSIMETSITRKDGCKMFSCPKCGFSFGEETDEWFKDMEAYYNKKSQ